MDVFVSYSRDDREIALRIAEILKRGGLKVWIDDRLESGDTFGAEINLQLIAAKVVLVLWSEAAVDSAWVRSEARYGLLRGALVSISLDGVLPPAPFDAIETKIVDDWDATPSKSWFGGDSHAKQFTFVKKKVRKSRATPNAKSLIKRFQSKLSKEHVEVVNQIQSIRSRALQVDENARRVLAQAKHVNEKVESGVSGYEVYPTGDYTWHGRMKREMLLFKTAVGYGNAQKTYANIWCKMSEHGRPVGESIMERMPGFTPPDQVVASWSAAETDVQFRGPGIYDAIGLFRYEGEIEDATPNGLGMAWTDDGTWVQGRWSTFYRVDGDEQLSVSGPAIRVSPRGKVEVANDPEDWIYSAGIIDPERYIRGY